MICDQASHELLYIFTLHSSIKDGVIRQYKGARTEDAVIEFVEGKYLSVDPVPSYISPLNVL